jgi:hypothetical protein
MNNCAGVVGFRFRAFFKEKCVGKKFCDIENLHNFLEINNSTAFECYQNTTMLFA